MPELPPPAPPETRTAGQLVAEALRLYGRRFWIALTLGIGPLVVVVVVNSLGNRSGLIFAATGGAFLLTLCYVVASTIAADVKPAWRTTATAVGIGVLVFAPVPFLTVTLIFPGLIWLAVFGLAVPVALIERRGLRESLRRAVSLARADFVHALGSLAALVVVALISAVTLAFLLGQFGDQSRALAALIPVALVSPLIFLGAALLYFDQEARLQERPHRKASSQPEAL